jgi:hypothetical protein
MKPNTSGIRVRRLRLFGTLGNDRTYEVSFLDKDGWRSLSVIAGASASGKTSVIDYILYCLGGEEYPDHEEMKANVRSAALEVDMNGSVYTIERTTVGTPSKFASVWAAELDNIGDAKEVRRTIEPPSDEESLSQWVLASFGLGNIKLPVSPSKTDTALAALSIRDVFRAIYFANSRLDGENLVLEAGNPFVALKFRQTVDLIFGVADESISDIAQRLQAAERAEKEAEKSAKTLRSIVDDEYPEGPAGVDILAGNVRLDTERLRLEIVELDRGVMQHQSATQSLRASVVVAESDLSGWALRVSNRVSLIDRLNALAIQYGDDKRKLLFLKEAERLFDPLHVTHCPVCLSKLEKAPALVENHCTLCGQDVTEGAAGEVDGAEGPAAKSVLLERELASTSRRLDQLVEYLGRLRTELRVFQASREAASEHAAGLSRNLDSSADLPAPYLAQRDALSASFAGATSELSRLELGARLWQRVEEADKDLVLRTGQVALLRRERRESVDRPDRTTVITALSKRFAEILEAFQYPKLSDAWLDDKLVPHVRGLHYTKASSGGRTLISVAWALTLHETAYERDANWPGLLFIDSPQKNLGANQLDPDFRDAKLVGQCWAWCPNRHCR